MDHDAFVGRAKVALQAKVEGRPDDGIAELRALLRDLESAVKDGVNEWHRQQALGMLIDALDAAGRRQECRAAWEALIAMTQDASTYWEKALASVRVDYVRWSEGGPAT